MNLTILLILMIILLCCFLFIRKQQKVTFIEVTDTDITEFYKYVEENKEVDKNIKEIIESGRDIKDSEIDLLEKIALDPILSLLYMGKNLKKVDFRKKQLLRFNFHLTDLYITDWRFAFYYIDKILQDNVINLDKNFYDQCLDILLPNNLNILPNFVDLTKSSPDKIIVLIEQLNSRKTENDIDIIKRYVTVLIHNKEITDKSSKAKEIMNRF